MGSAASLLWWRKKKPPEYAKKRREPLTSFELIMESEDGKERFQNTLDEHPPGTVFRWSKIIKMLSIDLAPTYEVTDPIRIQIDEEELKRGLKTIYDGYDRVKSDRIVLLRKYLPMMYDKHSVERGRRVSQKERNDNKITDECYAYGELNYEIFATMFEKISRAYGTADNAMFFDLGCGCGQLVYTAAMLSSKYVKCGGIEFIGALLDRGVKRMNRWDNIVKENFPPATRDIQMVWMNGDLFTSNVWFDSTFLLIHWTSFSNEQVDKLSDLLRRCKEGTHVVTITHPIHVIDNDFELLVKDECATSWGEADFFVYEKLTTPQL